jgi:CubicO group peptidase (beta-lactamase class C family)
MMNLLKIKLRCVAVLLVMLSSSTNAANSVEKLDQLFVEHLARIDAPGFSVSVVKDGKIVLAKGYGVVRNDKTEKMSKNTIIGIGSITKSFTAMMILQLQEQGLLNVDDVIVKHLPWFRAADKSKSDKITIRMFLNMTSGLETHFSQIMQNQSRRDDALEKGVRNISAYKVTRTPGQSFEYVNEGWNTLGLIIEKITGKTWQQALADSVLTPLAMSNTSADRKKLQQWPVANGHYAGVKPVPAEFIHIQNSLPSGSGFYSSAADLAHYMIALLNKGTFQGNNLLNPDSISRMWTTAVSMSILPYELGGNSDMGGYAMGWMSMKIDDADYIFHGGEFRVSSSLTVLEPAAGTGITILYNTGELNPYTSEAGITIVNNALRSLKGLPVSNFGVPRQAEPTINHYLASQLNPEKFEGMYLAKSGQRLDLKSGGSEGLLMSFMESIYPADFDIDFVNESNFIARNIAMNSKGYFTANEQGDIQSVNFHGEIFRRKNTDTTGMKPYDFKSLNMRFMLPESWTLLLNQGGFIAKSKKHSSAKLSGLMIDLSYDDWLAQLQQQAGKQAITQMTEFKNGYFYQSAIFLDRKGDKHINLYCTYRGKKYIFSLKGQPGNITYLAMNILNPFLSSLSLR